MYRNFAWRYFRSKKSTNAIHVISWISIGSIAIGTAALIIILSVFNGFEGFIKGLYTSFYPSVKVSAIRGKTFERDASFIYRIEKLEDVISVSSSLEEKILLSNSTQQCIAMVKGVDQHYDQVTRIKSYIDYGQMEFDVKTNIPPMVMGLGVANKLGVSERTVTPVKCYAFGGTSGLGLDVLTAFSEKEAFVQGVFYIQEDLDEKYAFMPLGDFQALIGKGDVISALEIRTRPGREEMVKKKITSWPAGKNLKCETRYEQNKTLYLVLRSERWAVFAILTLMLCIASFNIIGSLSMLVLDKQKDISILRTMGMTGSGIRRIFLSTGILLALIGAGLGGSLAWIICFLQQKFGFVKLGKGEHFLLEAYPVEMKISDFILVFITVTAIAWLASWYPSHQAARRKISLRNK